MKKSLLALAALTAFAGAASAQSSVTLFGIVDAGVARLSAGGKTKTGMTNSGYNSSRLGFRGVEDLGGGLQAGFWLEGQLTNDDGNAAGKLNFQRRSTVSLMGGFGEIRLGRDYTPTFWNTTVYDPFGTNGVGQALTPGMLRRRWQRHGRRRVRTTASATSCRATWVASKASSCTPSVRT
jgi:predicted porin